MASRTLLIVKITPHLHSEILFLETKKSHPDNFFGYLSLTSGTSTPTLFTPCFLGATFPVSSCINSHHAHQIYPQIGLSLAGIPIKPTLAPSKLMYVSLGEYDDTSADYITNLPLNIHHVRCPHNTIPSPTTKFGGSTNIGSMLIIPHHSSLLNNLILLIAQDTHGKS